ncbi:DUF885 domain-containing protein [Microbulbifer guangxiensis]|uniref:DUF885 domain-containing protein n=1 Tax=Microbulbifer guangxiensis TaxID=2904249 RepID=UPI001F38A4EE|nr:DUF885 domain-containing protein [Microbulbifer guangxiensis]
MRTFLATILAIVGSFYATYTIGMEDSAFEQAFSNLPKNDNPNYISAIQDLRLRWILESHPEAATFSGQPGPVHAWTDYSLTAIERRQSQLRRMLGLIRNLDPSTLSSDQRIDYQLLYHDLRTEVQGFEFPNHLMPLNKMEGIYRDVPRVFGAMPRRNTQDFETILQRLEALPNLIQQVEALIREGLSQGITPPQVTLHGLPEQIRGLIPQERSESPLLAPFRDMPDTIAQSEQERLRKRANAIYAESVAPAWRALSDVIEQEYIPNARVETPFTSLPNGKRWYAHKIFENTTTSLGAEEIHRIGLSEVSRIRDKMDSIIARTNFKGNFLEFTEFLRNDPRFYYTREEELLRGFRDIAKRIDGELPKLFGTLPRLSYGVKPMPAYRAKAETSARYLSGSLENGRAGLFWVNTYDLPSRPKWGMESLTIHEAVPGHHLQIAIANELPLHPLRRWGQYTAFTEGWALYAESLGYDLGLYTDPYSEFGALTDEMMRAVRLVVDTGMHQLGWSREQAREYFLANTSKPVHEVSVEIDRYLVWPGQALSYKLGQLQIKALRAQAEAQLGGDFDIRAFHDHLLSAGPLPLKVLEARMAKWLIVESERRGIDT